ncbi:MAG: hypothetical protein OES32_05620 [Acidobacteriota bacterium]|nr:hypothetical protein [Acidobacteriota bacterium]MDH3523049.1 hypothetical protein [Acidobacteriota bacterium]
MARQVRALTVLGLLLAPGLAAAGTVEVEFEVPVRSMIDLRGYETVTIAPFLVPREEGEAPIERRGVDVQEEFDRYMRRILRRRAQLKYVPPRGVDYPSTDVDDLAANADFWRVVAERSQADLVLSGSLDFDIQDRSGYRTQEYTSPYDGRTYYRQVLVERSGFEYDIVLLVFDGATGKLLHTDNFKDFKEFEGANADPLAGMFQNLLALEDRIAGVFTQKRIRTSRLLFTD